LISKVKLVRGIDLSTTAYWIVGERTESPEEQPEALEHEREIVL
jgi:hypothetical protein